MTRQPVLDRALDVQAYRLVTQSSGLADAFRDLDGDKSAARAIHDAFLAMDVWSVTGGKPAHVVLPRDLLLDGTATLLPAAGTVVEIGPEAGADRQAVEAVADLRARGYRVALRDVDAGDPRVGSVPADWAKVPVGPGAAGAARRARRHDLGVIITGVADAGSYLSARGVEPDGYEGPFLQGPALVQGRRLDGTRIGYLRLLQAVHRPELDFADLEERIKREVSLSWKFMNYANAAFFGWRAKMTSVRQGLVLLGEDGVRRWVSLIATSGLADGLPKEVVVAAVTRARFAERIVADAPVEASPLHAYLTGMFSLLDAMVDEPIAELLSQVAVPAPVAAAILRGEGRIGRVLDLVRAYEEADWVRVQAVADALVIPTDRMRAWYLESLAWSAEEGAPPASTTAPSS